jgi:soluble lytic murein transglycosylase
MQKRALVILVVLALLVAGAWMHAEPPARAQNDPSAVSSGMAGRVGLVPTMHPPFPTDLSQAWLVPERTGGSSRTPVSLAVGTAARAAARNEFSKALSAVGPPAARLGTLGPYATYYAGLAQLRLERASDALKSFRAVRAQQPVGYLSEAAALGEAAALEAADDHAAAVLVYESLLEGKPFKPDEIYMRLGLAAHLARDRNKSADAFGRVYYEFALSERAGEAGLELKKLGLEVAASGSPRYKLDLGRAERLFGARLYPAAREAFESLAARATDQDRPLIELRLAECDFYLRRFRSARDGVRPFADRGPRRAEAMYFYAVATRDSGDAETFLRVARRVADEFPTEPWAEEALNSLASYYLRRDLDDRADEIFREICEKYPKGRYTERAAWKAGWRAYRQSHHADAIAIFEHASSDFPRSDYRPAWLYWSARAYAQSNQVAAEQRLQVVVADYLNSYYGRLAARRLGRSASGLRLPVSVAGSGDIHLNAALPPNAPVIRALIDADAFDDAMNELRYAQRAWGDSPALQATIAWVSQQQAAGKKGTEQFQLLRGGITAMRRAYPQFLTAGGEQLPREVLTVIFPVAYWDLIRRFSALYSLDPYLVAALMAQESTFVADIRSSANAYGLMQLIPATAREYARKLSLRYSPSLLTRPESNVRMGTALLADLVRQYGDVAQALAAYNAGPRPVQRWVAERPGIDPEEFIDDIPYAETQNYVKRILGTTEDYRRLYAPAGVVVSKQ